MGDAEGCMVRGPVPVEVVPLGYRCVFGSGVRVRVRGSVIVGGVVDVA